MSFKIEEKIEETISGKVKELGFEIEYIEFVKEGNQNILRIVIDKPEDSISIDDCELVSRAVEEDIDILVTKEYILEVSSPGLERQLKNIKLYKKYTGSRIDIKLYKKSEIGKEFEALLKNIDDVNENIVIEINNKEHVINLKDISSAHTVYNFDELLKINKNEKINMNELKKF